MDRMKGLDPLFCDMTWGAGGSTSELSMELSKNLQDKQHLANLHLTCTNLIGSQDPKAEIRKILQSALDNKIENIVALRGDPPEGVSDTELTTTSDFSCALDLVKFMKAEFPDSFGIAVAGYPEGHPNAITEVPEGTTLSEAEAGRSSTREGKTFTCRDADFAKELAYLKEKVDAGADFIITQMFLDVQVYDDFIKACRAIGINCPIIPGLLCFGNAAGFHKMTKFCKTRVPESLQIPAEADDIKEQGVNFLTKLCQDLAKCCEPPKVLHFYTLNLEKVVQGVLENLQK